LAITRESASEMKAPLKHHNALSDAEACAKIMITVEQVRLEKAAK